MVQEITEALTATTGTWSVRGRDAASFDTSRLLKKSADIKTNDRKESRRRPRRINVAGNVDLTNRRYEAASRKSFFSSLLGKRLGRRAGYGYRN